MKFLAIVASLSLAGVLLAQPSAPAAQERHRVEASLVDGEWRCSIYARQADLHTLLEELSEQCGARLDGIDAIPADTRVVIDLRDRSVHHALEVILGSVGRRAMVRTDSWTITQTLRAPASPEDLRAQSLSAYLSALREFPSHPAGADALMHQAEIEVKRGNHAAAHVVLDGLVERYPDSAHVPEAMYRGARSLIDQRDWEQAASRLADLLRLPGASAYEAPARVELARCMVWLGEVDRALTMLDALDSIAPASEVRDEQRRLFVRARALVESDSFEDAAEVLDRTTRASIPDQDLPEYHALRARIHEGQGSATEAARSWLALSETTTGVRRKEALENAARLALESGDEVSVLMIHALAEEAGEPAGTRRLAEEARLRLDLDQADVRRNETMEVQLVRAETLVAEGLHGQALELLGELDADLSRFSEGQMLRFALSYGRSLASAASVDDALAVFRNVLPALGEDANRRAVYMLAAELLEEAGRLDDAIEALQGKL